MSKYGTLTIRFEFVRKREGISTWQKAATLLSTRNITHDDAMHIAQEFRTANPSICDSLHIFWQAHPVFIR